VTTALEASLRLLASDLDALQARWAIIGGFAVSARAEPRFTRDVDVCVLVDGDEQAEELASGLTRRGYEVVAIVEHEQADRLATLRLVAPFRSGVLVDLLFASSGLESEIVESAQVLEILPNLLVPVARTPHLVVLKLLARDDATRPQDAMDLRALRKALDASEAAEVRRLAALVVERGFNRDRDLSGLADAYLSE
jgi:hypothetical protein